MAVPTAVLRAAAHPAEITLMAELKIDRLSFGLTLKRCRALRGPAIVISTTRFAHRQA